MRKEVTTMNKEDTLKQICKMIASGEIPDEVYDKYLSKTPIGFMNETDLYDFLKGKNNKISDLEDNWDKLRKWIVYNKHNENTEQHYLVVDYGMLIGKMQELEQGSDSNE